jgi:hypothetical protein
VSERDASFQRLDPVGAYISRPVTLVLSVGIVVVAAGVTLLNRSGVTNSLAAYLAVAMTALASMGVIYWSSPLRAPFRRLGSVTIFVLAAVALGLSAMATWGSPPELFEQWAPAAFGLFIAELAPYRPTRELAGATVLGGILAGFLAVLHPESLHAPFLVAAIESAVPLLALGFGATAYTAALVRSVGRWYTRPLSEGRVASAEVRRGVAKDVYIDRISILNHTVVPYFTELLGRNVITADDRERAREIAISIRSVMVVDVDRSWLDAVIDHISTERGDGSTPGSEVVQDYERLAVGMTTEQRIVMRAVVVALFDHPGFDPDGFAVLITRAGESAVVTLTAKLDLDESLPRSALGAYFAVLRIAFDDFSLTFHRPTLALKFSYEHK